MTLLRFVLFISLCWSAYSSSNYVVGGYYPLWAKWSTSTACKSVLSTFDASPFTHIWLAYGQVHNGGSITVYDASDSDITTFKNNHPNIKVFISLGGSGAGPVFELILESADARNTFISQVISKLRSLNLDGIDIEYIVQGDEAIKFASLLSELRTAINVDQAASGKPALLLTIPTWYQSTELDEYPIAELAKHIDWFNVMAFNEGVGAQETFIQAPIKSTDGKDITNLVDGYLNAGVSPSKLVLAAPARAWVLRPISESHSVGTPAEIGLASGCLQRGALAYPEVEAMISEGATVVWDQTAEAPYCYTENDWVTYDNPQSFAAKAAFVKSKQLRGLLVWYIADDNSNALINSAATTLNS